jgi:hypothetical protein
LSSPATNEKRTMNAKKLPQQGTGFDIDVDPAAVTDPPHSLGSPSLQETQSLQPLQQHERVSLLTEGRNIPSKHRLYSVQPDVVAWSATRSDPSVAINDPSVRLFDFRFAVHAACR